MTTAPTECTLPVCTTTPACTSHCAHTDWPFDPEGHDQRTEDQLGWGQDHPDEDGVYAVYRTFGMGFDSQRVWVELVSGMIPSTEAPVGYISYPPHRSRPDKPHL